MIDYSQYSDEELLKLSKTSAAGPSETRDYSTMSNEELLNSARNSSSVSEPSNPRRGSIKNARPANLDVDQRPLSDKYDDAARSFFNVGDAFKRNLTFGISDKAEALKRASGYYDSKKFGQPFQENYNTEIENIKAEAARFKEAHPIAYQLGGTPGYVASALIGGPVSTIGKAAATGARLGAFGGLGEGNSIDPEEVLFNSAKGAAIGGATGGALVGGVRVAEPVARWLGKTVSAFVAPFTATGRERILDQYRINKGGVDPETRTRLIAALENAQTYVPGSRPTSAQAMSAIPEATGLAAHEAIIAKTPGVSGGFVTREGEQEAARAAALQGVGKTAQELAAAEAQRGLDATVNYGRAYSTAIKADSDLARLSQNPYFADALPDALKLAEAKGVNSKEGLTEVLHYVKISLDKMLSRRGDTALAKTEQAAVNDLKDQLVGWMGKKNPAYDEARLAFAEASKPINEMQVGQFLSDKLASPLEASERAAAFATAVKDAPATLKTSTGSSRYNKLEDVLSPENTASVNAVLEDLKRKAATDALAKGTNLPGGSALKEGQNFRLPNLLSTPATIANYLIKTVGEGADAKINKVAAEQYLDPKKLAEALKKFRPKSPKDYAALKDLVTRAAIKRTTDQKGVEE